MRYGCRILGRNTPKITAVNLKNVIVGLYLKYMNWMLYSADGTHFETTLKEPSIFILLIFLLFACGHNENWTEFHAEGLPSSDNSYQLLKIIDDYNQYLGGSRIEMVGQKGDQYNFAAYCVLYHSSDHGRTWKEVDLGKQKGEISYVRKNQDDLFILNQSVSHDSTTALRSRDNGITWNTLFSFSRSYYISDVELRQNDTIELIARTLQNTRLILRCADQMIDTISFDPKIKQLYFSENGYRGTEIGKDKNILLVSFDWQGNEIDRKPLKTKKAYSSIKRTSNNDILWYDSYSANNIILFRNDEIYEIDLSDFKNYRVKEPYVEDSLIIIDGFYSEDAAFLGVTHTFLVSYDFGRTWAEEAIPDPMQTAPGDLKNGRFLSYAGIGRLQERRSLSR